MTEDDTKNPDTPEVPVPTGGPHKDAQQILKACLGIANQTIKLVLGGLFETIHEKQSQSASDMGLENDQDENSLQAGLQKILLEKNTLTRTFHAAFTSQLRELFQATATSVEPATENDLDHLSLVNEIQLEEVLAIDNLEAKLADRFSHQLFGLEQRFRYLFPQAHITSRNNPLCPRLFCAAFHDAITCLQIDVKAALYAYKIYDHAMIGQMGQLYQEVNAYLIGEGILPRLQHRLANSDGASQPSARPTTVSELPNDTAHHMAQAPGMGSMPLQSQMFQAITQLFNAQCQSGLSEGINTGPLTDSETPALIPATPLLLNTLSDLQQDFSAGDQRSTDLIGAQLKNQVKTHFGSQEQAGKSASINQIDDETIDVISMIFDYILDDRSLPDFIKALIGRLQIPILKVAIIDREFFSRKSHPARQLLNDLAYAGVGWSDESEAAKDRLYERMESIVLRILHEFDDDVVIFQQLLDEFRDFIEEEKQKFLAAQEKISNQAHEAEYRERLKHQVAEMLADKLKDAQLPENVRNFIMTDWRRVMTEASLHASGHKAEQQRSLQVVDDLIWSLQLKETPEERKRMILVLPLMLDALRDGLTAAGFSEGEIAVVTDMLEVHHLAILKTQAPVTHDNESTLFSQTQDNRDGKASVNDIDRKISAMHEDVDALPDIGLDDLEEFDFNETLAGQSGFDNMMAEMGLEQDFDDGPRIEDEYTERVRNLEIGNWIELSHENGGTMRVKLAWKGDQFTNFSFVNRQYKVVAERPFFVLADDFRQGRAAVIEDVALFDRALDGVISGIMKFAN